MDENQDYYEDVFDLREIVQRMLDRWKLIAGVTLLAGAAGLALSLLMPKQYKGSSIVVLTNPDVIFRFDPRIETRVEAPAGQGIPEIALSDGILQLVLESDAAQPLDDEILTLDVFRNRVNVKLVGTVLNLSVEGNDPALVAELANAWSDTLTHKLNALFASTPEDQIFYEEQAATAKDKWVDVQKELIDYQATNPETVLEQLLKSKADALSILFQADRQLSQVAIDLHALRERIAIRTSEEPNIPDSMNLLFLSSRALTSGVSVDSMAPMILPIQLEFNAGDNSLFQATSEMQIAEVDALANSIQQQRSALRTEIDRLQADILSTQEVFATVKEERASLEQDRDLAQEAYQALARKAQETELAGEEQESIAKVASRATAPSKAISPNIILNTALGMISGIVVGVFSVLFIEWWIRDEPEG